MSAVTALGAALGTAIPIPILGTIAGAVAGLAMGGLILLGKYVYDKAHAKRPRNKLIKTNYENDDPTSNRSNHSSSDCHIKQRLSQNSASYYNFTQSDTSVEETPDSYFSENNRSIDDSPGSSDENDRNDSPSPKNSSS